MEIVIEPHAMKRALQMAVNEEHMRKAIFTPRTVGWDHRHGTENRTYKTVTVCVRYEGDVAYVTTVKHGTAAAVARDMELPSYDRDDLGMAGTRKFQKAYRRNRGGHRG